MNAVTLRLTANAWSRIMTAVRDNDLAAAVPKTLEDLHTYIRDRVAPDKSANPPSIPFSHRPRYAPSCQLAVSALVYRGPGRGGRRAPAVKSIFPYSTRSTRNQRVRVSHVPLPISVMQSITRCWGSRPGGTLLLALRPCACVLEGSRVALVHFLKEPQALLSHPKEVTGGIHHIR